VSISRVKTWVALEVLFASDLNAEFNNVLNNGLSLISPLTGNLDVNNTQLLNAKLEVKSATQAVSGAGRTYWQSAEGTIHVDTGTLIGRVPALTGLQQNTLIAAVNPSGISGATTYAAVGLGTGFTITGGVLTPPVAPLSALEQLTGLGLTRTSSTAITVAVGACTSDDAVLLNRVLMSQTASIQGNTGGTFVVGNNQNKLDAGSIAASTWYHVFSIQRVDTGVVDILFSTSATAPAMPANYTKQRRIGSFKTDAAFAMHYFTQDGDYIRLATSFLDVSSAPGSTAAVTATLASVPTGVKVGALFNGMLLIGANSSSVYFSDLSANDELPIGVGAALAVPGFSVNVITANSNGAQQMVVQTNTSAQIRYRVSSVTGGPTVGIVTLGWYDRRGRG